MTIFVGKNIKFLRVKNDITQDKIGDLISKSGKTISSYESGQAEPNITALAILSKEFGITTDALLFSDLENSELSENIGEMNEPPPQYKVGKQEKKLDKDSLQEKRYELLLVEMEAIRKRLHIVEQELRERKSTEENK